MENNHKDNITGAVHNFYNEIPFNYRNSAQDGSKYISGHNQIKNYPNVERLFSKSSGIKVLDVGSGTGWFSNTVAYYYGFDVTGLDLSEKAVERARETARELKLNNCDFRCVDLFKADLGEKFDFVNSLGVLHHTYDCKLAVQVISSYVKDGGCLHLGLYHKYGREPFLELFRKYREKVRDKGALDEGEFKEAFDIYRELNSNISDEAFLFSWFRDQVLHPHETQHTLKEVSGWLAELGFNIESTSINKFEKINDLNSLFEHEKKYRALSVEKNIIQKKYFPGFFTVLSRR